MPPKKKSVSPPPTSIGALREKMTKKYGTGRVQRRSEVKPYDTISTGSLSLDLAVRVGGWVCGRIHEIVGQEGVGKTTVSIASMAQAQKKFPDKACGYIDMEQTFDWDWAEANGLDTSDDRFVHAFPDNSEDVSDQIKEMMETGLFSMIVVDSIGGMESKQAFDKEAEEHVMGRNAQIITRMSKRLAMLARKYHVVVLLVNQYRANFNPNGSDISAGPKAMKYATTMKVDFKRIFEEGILTVRFPGERADDIVGKKIGAHVTRNKVAAEGKRAEFWIITQPSEEYGPVGIDVAEEALTIGIYTGVVQVAGGGYHTMPWTAGPKDRIRGRDTVLAYLREHRDKAMEVRDAAVARMASDVIPDVEIHFDPATGEVLDPVPL